MLPADADFLAFKEQLERGPEPLPSAEAQLEKQEAKARERQAAGKHDGSRGAVQAKLCSRAGVLTCRHVFLCRSGQCCPSTAPDQSSS